MAEDQGVSSREVKVVVVGDGSVGKTCLCNVFVHREFPEAYEPTVFENHTQELTVNGMDVTLQLWDTAGQEDFGRIRVLSYKGTDCFVVCFSLVDGVTFNNIQAVWLDEIRSIEPSAKILLVGTKADLKGTAKNKFDGHKSIREKEITDKSVRKMVKKEGLHGYIETSAKRGGEDVDRVFHEAIRISVSDSTDNGRLNGDTGKNMFPSSGSHVFDSCILL